MCDYSLQYVANRPAKVGDKLVRHSSPTRSRAAFRRSESPTSRSVCFRGPSSCSTATSSASTRSASSPTRSCAMVSGWRSASARVEPILEDLRSRARVEG